jgi:replicative DNA helicase
VETELGRIQMAAAKKPLSVSMLSAMTQSIAKITEAYHGDTGLSGISTGLRELDVLIGGLAPGRCYVLAGRPSMGKSATALNIAVRAAMRGEGGWFGSLEMPATELANRFLSQMLHERNMKVPYSDLERGNLSEDEFRSLIMAAKEFADLPLDIGNPNTRTFSRVRAAIKRTQDRLGDKMKLMVIDYLQKLIPPGNLRELDRISACAEFCKNMALETELPMLALAQLSRGVESRDNKRPILSDLRGSGEIEQEADTVIFAYRDAYYLENQMKGEKDGSKRVDMFNQLERTRDDLELIVAKQRGGRTGTALQKCELAFNNIYDKPEGAQDGEELPF